ncbi:MAG: exopolysaccharide Pel transporter PelG [Candidatus Limivivens sp.]|nr:exopolysaccharide Pel transporter PelG [Candidatus Limivivens sp.]
MAGVGFELKKIFKDNSGLLNSLKGYSVTAVVTEGPMVLTMVMLFMLRYLMKLFHATFREQEIFLFMITYVLIFSLILSNTVLMFINRYISDCIYKEELDAVLPSFFGIIFFLLLFGDLAAILYLMTLPVSMTFRIAALIQFSCMLVLWVQMAYLSAIKQYSQILIGFLFGAIVSIGLAAILMNLGLDPLMTAMWSASLGFLVMMFLFMSQLLAYYPFGNFNLFQFFPALDQYKILVATGFFMALGLYSHNFVIWFSEFRNQVFPTGVYCTRYDIPAFFATLTILPLLVQFVVSLETNFCVKNRAYFDTILYGGRLTDIRAAKKDMQNVLYRELAHMMEIQIIFTLFCVTILGNFLQSVGLDQEMTGIYRILCFGYCIYGFAKCMIIILLYFDDRTGACIGASLFALSSTLLTAVTLKTGTGTWGMGFLAAGLLTSVYLMVRLKNYLNHLEYHVFCQQPLFNTDEKGIFLRMEERFRKSEEEFQKRSKEHAQE